jgi:hypothetical protein
VKEKLLTIFKLLNLLINSIFNVKDHEDLKMYHRLNDTKGLIISHMTIIRRIIDEILKLLKIKNN